MTRCNAVTGCSHFGLLALSSEPFPGFPVGCCPLESTSRDPTFSPAHVTPFRDLGMHRIPSVYLVPCTGSARFQGLSRSCCFSGDLLCFGSWVPPLSLQAWQLPGAAHSLGGGGVKSPSRPLGLVAGQVKGPFHWLRLMSSRETIWLWGPPSAWLPARLAVAFVLFCLLCGAGSGTASRLMKKVFSLPSGNR